jgi:hypothetical protein
MTYFKNNSNLYLNMDPSLKGTFGTGSVIGLNAVGKQDKFLSNLVYAPENSMFTPDNKQHSSFTRYFRDYVINNKNDTPGWPFNGDGQTVIFTLNPGTMGDFLSNMILKITIPRLCFYAVIGGDIKGFTDFTIDLFEYIDFCVDDKLIQRLDAQMLRNLIDMFPAGNETLIEMMGDINEAYDENAVFTIPLIFWFSSFYTTYPGSWDNKTNIDSTTKGIQHISSSRFPLCAITNEQIFIKIKFQPQFWFCSPALDPKLFFDGMHLTNIPMYVPNQVYCKSITLVTEEINVSQEEKYHYLSTLTSQVVKIPSLRLKQQVDNASTGVGHVRDFKFKIMSEYPLQGIFWFFINKKFLQKNESNIFWSRDHFNYTVARMPNWYEAPPAYNDGGQDWDQDFTIFDTDVAALYNPQLKLLLINLQSAKISPIQDVSILVSNDLTVELPSNTNLQIGTVSYFTYVQRLIKNIGCSIAPTFVYIFDDNISQNYITSSTDVSIMNGEKEYYVNNKFGNFYVYVENSEYVLFYYNIEYKKFNFSNGYMAITAP